MNYPQTIDDSVNHNQRSLNRLSRAISLSQGQFSLIIVCCNYQCLQQAIINQLLAETKYNLSQLTLKTKARTLFTNISQHLKNLEAEPDSIIVCGFDQVINLDELLLSTNQVRDEFRKNFPFPVVLWVNDHVLRKMMKLAPDFNSWAAATIKFDFSNEELIKLLEGQTRELINHYWQSIIPELIDYSTIQLDFPQRLEMENAMKELQVRGYELNIRLKAHLEFLLAIDDYQKANLEDALAHYQTSLDLWEKISWQVSHQVDDLPILEQTFLGNSKEKHCLRDFFSNPPIVQKGLIYLHIALCHRCQAINSPLSAYHNWQQVKKYLLQSQQVFLDWQQPFLLGIVYSILARVLGALEEWSELEDLVLVALPIHEKHGDSRQVAEDYACLATVALSRCHWQDSFNLINYALDITKETPNTHAYYYCLLVLSKTLWSLGQQTDAITYLEEAKAGEELLWHKNHHKSNGYPRLYVRILQELRSQYYQRGEYLASFRLKREQKQIEHQYGLLAFIGAIPLQPQQDQHQKNAIPPEITASSRQKDINKLLERVGRDDHKLTIIHGPSGVGKSSLVNAGLVPALDNISIVARTTLPVVMKVYSNWVEELSRTWQRVLQAKTAMNDDESSQDFLYSRVNQYDQANVTITDLLSDFHSKTQQNYFIILIFDQFEEFFFTTKNADQTGSGGHHERLKFYRFLQSCLNLPYVKVIMSMREDYLHYLLECDNIEDFDVINHNILDKNIRYPLRNFSQADAYSVIECLTKRSKFDLEPALIDTLVESLTDDKQQIRPIELQVVGTQLQEASPPITSLKQFQKLGITAQNAKERLIRHFLEQVIKDCGPPHEESVLKILFSLTDEKFTRPIRSKQELASMVTNHDPKTLTLPSSQKPKDKLLKWSAPLREYFQPTPYAEPAEMNTAPVLDFALEILGNSGLLFIRQDSGENRYQLVHDYLVKPIRQRYDLEKRLRQAEAGKAQAEADKMISQKQLNKVLQRQLATATASLFVLAGATITALGFWQRAELENQRADINNLTAMADALSFSDQNFDALLEGLRAGRQWENLQGFWYDGADLVETKTMIAASLQKAVYGIKERNRLEGHNDAIWGVTFRPQGDILASASVDKTVKLWNKKGILLDTLFGHRAGVSRVSFSPNGQILASSSRDHTIKLWQIPSDYTSGEPSNLQRPQVMLINTLEGHQDWITAVSFSPNGEILASSSLDKTIKIWNKQGKLLKTINNNVPINWMTFSPDGKSLATADDQGQVKLWDINGRLLTTIQHDLGNYVMLQRSWKVHSVNFSPDGRRLLTAGDDQTVKIWRLVDKKAILENTLKGHEKWILSATFSPDGQMIASASADNKVIVWDLNGKILKILTGHGDRVTQVSFSPDGKLLASASQDKMIKLWDMQSPLVEELFSHNDRVTEIDWHPQGQFFASASYDNTIQIRNRQGGLLARLFGHKHRVSSVSFSPNGRYLVSGSYDKNIKLWYVHPQLSPYKVPPDDLADCPSSHCLITEERTFRGHTDSVMSVSFSPDGRSIVSGGKDNTVRIWSMDGNLVKTLKGHESWVNRVRFSPNGEMIASASDDGKVKLWNQSGVLLRTIPAHKSWVLGVTFSPDGEILATAGYDNTVKLWDLQGKLLATLLKGASDSATSVSFSPDGQTLASGSYDGKVRLWSRSGQLLKTLVRHQDSVLTVSFSPDGKILATGDRTKNIILWNLDLDHLLHEACEWVGDYLITNPNVSASDRQLCDS